MHKKSNKNAGPKVRAWGTDAFQKLKRARQVED